MRFNRAMVTVLCAGLVLAVVPTALGHTEIVKRSPAKGAVLAHLPAKVTLTFAEPLLRVDDVQVLRGSKDCATRVRLNPKNARQVIVTTRGDREGRHRVVWSVTGPDGHTVAGRYTFFVRR